MLVDYFLRFATDKYKTYLEENGFPYQSLYKVEEWHRRFNTYNPNMDFSFKTTEFIHSRKTNSLGLPDREFKTAKDENEFRVIALGDSYTEGIGTTYEMTWVKNVERILSKKYPNKLITVFNCGVKGSDVIFEYMLLKEKLLKYKPDLVITAINASDINEIIFRGGTDRFTYNGKVKFNNPPKWEKLYATSFVFRLIIHELLHYDSNLIKKKEFKYRELQALNKIGETILEFKDLSIKNNFNLLIVFHPYIGEIIEGYDLFGDVLGELLKDNKIDFIDLLKIYSNKNQITPKNANEFYWPRDLHHNTKGYQIMGYDIADKIIEQNYIN